MTGAGQENLVLGIVTAAGKPTNQVTGMQPDPNAAG